MFLRNICICLPTHMPRHLRRQSCLFSLSYEHQILFFKSSVTCQRPEATSEYCGIIKWNCEVLEIQLDRRRCGATWWHGYIPYQEKRIFICRLTQCKLWCPKACLSSAIWLINDFVSENQNVFLNENCVVLYAEFYLHSYNLLQPCQKLLFTGQIQTTWMRTIINGKYDPRH
jgi:hypothetical protein